jgi:hypothetical protein
MLRLSLIAFDVPVMLCYVTPNRENLIAMAKECKICGARYRVTREGVIGLCPVCVFWTMVDKTSSPHGCWLWSGKLDRDGYGAFGITLPSGHHEKRTPRLSWILTNGDIPDGLQVLHNCDELYSVGDKTNRRCVNPSHLRLGTASDNMSDCIVKGRMATGILSGAYTNPDRIPRGDLHHARLRPEKLARGVNAGLAKLDDDIVREIRASKETLKTLAARYGVFFSTIHKIRTGLTWRHVV